MDFIDINFWFKCVLGRKSSRKKQKARFNVETVYFTNLEKKIKNIFKLVYLDGTFSSESTLTRRIFSSKFDIFFNYKNSLIYKRKLTVYKKLFQ